MFAATAGGTYRTLFRQHTVPDGIFGASANAMMVLVDCTRDCWMEASSLCSRTCDRTGISGPRTPESRRSMRTFERFSV